jgi:hypothetical protein
MLEVKDVRIKWQRAVPAPEKQRNTKWMAEEREAEARKYGHCGTKKEADALS